MPDLSAAMTHPEWVIARDDWVAEGPATETAQAAYFRRTVAIVRMFLVESGYSPAAAALRESFALVRGACKYCTPTGGVHEDGCPFKVGT